MAMTACTPDGGGPEALGAVDEVSELSMPTSAAVTPLATWGVGRAQIAAYASTGEIVVTTTNGVYHGGPGDGAFERFDQLPANSIASAMTVSASGGLAAVGFTSPAMVRVYDLGLDTLVGSQSLPIDSSVRSLTFDPADRLIIDTASGPYVIETPSDPPAKLVDAPAVGSSAVLATGEVVTPIVGTNELEINGSGSSERHALALGQGATVLDARLTPDGSTLAVSTGVGDNLFERTDQIVLLDPTTFGVRGTIDAGIALDPVQWALSDLGVAVSAETGLTTYSFDGTGTPIAAPVDVAITRLLPVPTGLLVEYASGAIARVTDTSGSVTILAEPGTSNVSATTAPTGDTVTFVDRYGRVSVRRAIDGTEVAAEERAASGELTGIAVGPNGQIGVGSTLGKVTVLDAALSVETTLLVEDHPVEVGAVSFDPVNGFVAAGVAQRVSESAFDDTVRVFGGDSWSPRFVTGGEAESVVGCSFFYGRVRFNAAGSLMAIASHDFSVQVVDVETGTVVHTFAGLTTVLDIAFSHDGERLVASYDDGSVKVWNALDFSDVASYRAPQGGFLAIAPTPDAALIATADITGAISLVELETGAVVQTLAGATDRTYDLVVSPDGALIAAPTSDGGVAIWSTLSGEQLAVATGHAAEVTDLAFSPDGAWLATSSADGTVRTWSVAVT